MVNLEFQKGKPNISFISMARHPISSLDRRGKADFDELIHKISTEP